AAGLDLDWRVFQAGRRVPLPAYPFRAHRHWIEPVAVETAHTAPIVEAAADRGPVLDRIIEVTAELLGAGTGDVRPDDDFVELGADSLSLVNLTRRILEDHGVRIPMRELFDDLTTPAKLAGAVATRSGRAVPAPTPVMASALATVPRDDPDGADGGVRQIINRQLALMEEQLRLLDRPPPPALVEPPAARPVAPAPLPAEEPPTDDGEALLDFSLYFFGDYPDGRAGAYRHILDAAGFADENGFHAVWMPERHFHSFGGIFPNPSVLASAIAARTSRVRLNAGSVVLPLHHPVRVAEEWSMVDNLSGGRVGLGVAPGWSAQDFVFAPENYGRHKQVMYDNLATVRDLWAGKTHTARGGGGEDVEVRLFPRPVQDSPPMFTAIVGNPDSYRQAAANDLGVITNLMTQDVAALAANIALYRAARAEHGLDPAAGRVVVLLHTHLGPDDATAKRTAFEPFCAYLRSSLSLLGQVANSLGMDIDFANTPEDDLRFMLERAYERYCAERALIGSPERVASIARAVKDAGADEIAAFIDFGMTAAEVAGGLPHLDALRRSFLVAAPETATVEAPMSPGQRRLWTADRIGGGGPGYNEAAAVRLDGPLDRGALRRALQAFVDRHGAMRTLYGEAGGEPRQFVRPHVDAGLLVTEHEGADVAAVAAEAMAAESRRAFDLAAGPVFAFRLLAFGPDTHVLVSAFHHIAADGWSYGVFGDELGRLYRAEVTGRPAELAPITVTYAELSRERATRPVDEGGIAFWRRTLADAPPPWDLPGVLPRPDRPSDTGRSVFLELPPELTGRVLAHARNERVTPFTILLSGIAGAIRRLTGRADFTLGSGVGIRDERTEGLVGFMVETVPLRFDLTGAASFRALTSRVSGIAAAAIDHADVPFDEIVRAVNPSRVPGSGALFDIAVEYYNSSGFAFDLPGITATRLPLGLDKSPSDLTLYMSCDDTVRWHVEYRGEIYREETVRDLFAAFREVLDAGVSAPDAPLDSRRPRLVPALEGPPSRAAGETLHGTVDRSIRAHRERVAVVCEDERWTYGELGERADAAAGALRSAGVTAGDVVAVCLPRRPRLIAAQLAVLRLGAVLLPLDPTAPPARLRALVEACRARAVVGPNLGASVALDVDTLPATGPVVAVDVDPESAAYCIFTSGSTGRPKGVLVPHRAAANTVRWRAEATGLGPGDVVGHHLGLGFDANLAEIYPALAAGATVHLVPDEVRADPQALTGWWAEHRITTAFL
ncbi:MAG TPA: MupA/Atu3671 family FMN-dependent luciferase-like monooxygenase, partial [Phytomonospora sp.]